MATLLLAVIYISFIGLGLPDALFGTAWPVMYREFDIPVSYGGFVTVMCFAGTVISSLLAARVINRIGTQKVAVLSTSLCALAVLGYSFAPSFLWVCLFAPLLGLGGGAIDTALNNYVALHYSASQMNYLHCFYGLGVAVSPFIMGMVIMGPMGWRGGYRLVFFLLLGIALISAASAPLWKRKGSGASAEEDDAPGRVLSLRELAKIPSVRAIWLCFFCSCGIEVSAGTWAATFLVDYKGSMADTAAKMVVLYYGGMTLGRLISGWLSHRVNGWDIIKLGQVCAFVGIVLVALPFEPWLSALGFCLIGFGNGPVYPNLCHLVPASYGRDVSHSVLGSILAFANSGSMICPPIFGIIARALGVELLPWFLLVCFVPLAAGMLYAAKSLKK